MNYYGAKELAESFRTVRKNTLAIAQDIPADKYSFRPAPDSRSIAELLTPSRWLTLFQYQVHAVERRALPEGFDFPSLMGRMMAEEKKPRSKDEIWRCSSLAKARKWAGWLQGISENFLSEQVQMPGANPASKSRFEMILSAKDNDTHQRAAQDH